MEIGRHALKDAHGAVALDVGMAADRAHASTGLANVSLEQQHVDHIAQHSYRVLVLSQAHGPADHGGLGCQQPFAGGPDLGFAQARGSDDLRPGDFLKLAQIFTQARGVGVDERRVEHAASI